MKIDITNKAEIQCFKDCNVDYWNFNLTCMKNGREVVEKKLIVVKSKGKHGEAN